MSTTAILTYTHRVIATPYNSTGIGANSYILQSTQFDQTKDTPEIDLTNSEANGVYVLAPGILKTTFDLAGILDTSGNFDAIYTGVIQNKYYCQMQCYVCKLGTDPNPVIYTATGIFTNAKLECKTTANGDIWKYTAKVVVCGSLTRSGAGFGPGGITAFGS